jgi:predicted TIM-barrel fold metal-dependent hydrolase
MMRRSGVDRAVVVQPSVLGLDNRCSLDALEHLTSQGLEGRVVAVLPNTLPASELDDLHRAGVRGLRVNLQSNTGAGLAQAREALQNAIRLCERHAWHVQLFVNRQMVQALSSDIENAPIEVVLDHFAGLSVSGCDDESSLAVLRLLGSGNIHIKLSGNYRITDDAFDLRLADLARDLAGVNPEHLIWGSDWPHTPKHAGQAVNHPTIKPYRRIDTNRLSGAVFEWFEPPLAKRVLVENPARLYDFSC